MGKHRQERCPVCHLPGTKHKLDCPRRYPELVSHGHERQPKHRTEGK